MISVRATAAVLILALFGCGLKGDLYLPEETGPPADTPAEIPAAEAADDDAED